MAKLILIAHDVINMQCYKGMLVLNDSNVLLPKGTRMYYEHFKLKLHLYQSETGTQFDLSSPSQQLAFPFSKDIHERQVPQIKSKMQNKVSHDSLA